jgi:hypothetical protein
MAGGYRVSKLYVSFIPPAFRIKFSAKYRQVKSSYVIRFGNKDTFYIYIN